MNGQHDQIHVPPQILEGIWPRANERGYTIDERPARTSRRLKVITVGAGMAGINMALKISQRQDEFDLTVFDQAEQVGGNWFWNRYPGLACDNAGVTYQFIKETKPDWSQFYSPGPEIRQYLQDIVDKHSLEEYLRLGHQVTSATWSDEASKWTVEIKDVKTGKTSTETSDIVVSAVGPLHHPKWPKLKNMESYKGELVHASRYPEHLDLKDKRVAVLGTGSTGVQLVPAILSKASKIYHWIRQPTYILPQDAEKMNFAFTEEQKKKFAADPQYYLKYRKALESGANKLTGVLLSGTDASKHITDLCVKSMRERLTTRPDIAEKIVPKTFDFGCRRPTPGPGYLEALCDPRVETHLQEMREMTERGFIDAWGKEHEVDAFICATGFDSSYVPSFPIISRGENLQDRWAREDPNAYLSLATPGFPNYFILSGPWGPTAHGSAMPIADLMVDSFLSWFTKMSEEQISSMEVTNEATEDFLEHAKLWVKRTVFMQPCNSWWKATKSGLPLVFPGSRVSLIEAVSNFRAEDWKFRYPSGNRFRFWGNGFHPKELGDVDDTYYLGLIDGKTTAPDYGDIILEQTPHAKSGTEKVVSL